MKLTKLNIIKILKNLYNYFKLNNRHKYNEIVMKNVLLFIKVFKNYVVNTNVSFEC